MIPFSLFAGSIWIWIVSLFSWWSTIWYSIIQLAVVGCIHLSIVQAESSINSYLYSGCWLDYWLLILSVRISEPVWPWEGRQQWTGDGGSSLSSPGDSHHTEGRLAKWAPTELLSEEGSPKNLKHNTNLIIPCILHLYCVGDHKGIGTIGYAWFDDDFCKNMLICIKNVS